MKIPGMSAGAFFALLPFCAAAADTIPLDATRQLFLDDYVVASAKNVRRVIHSARKFSGNPVLDNGILYGSVIRDGSKYRMWYFAGHAVAYAESLDGIAWVKPEFDFVPMGGRRTNLIAGRRAGSGSHQETLPAGTSPEVAWPHFYELFGVYKDAADPAPSRRYKMGVLDLDFEYKGTAGDPFHEGQRRGLGVSASGDGIHWTVLREFATEAICDGGTHWMFDPSRRKYILYGRTKFLPPETAEAWGFNGPPGLRIAPALHQWIQGHTWGRAVARLESPDFLEWDYTRGGTAPVVIAPDTGGLPGDEPYDMMVFPYEGIYIGLVKVYHNLPDDPTLDVQLTVSRDTRHFARVGDRTPFLPVGNVGEWDRFNHSLPTNPPIAVGDELRFYYSGSNVRHSPYSGPDSAPRTDAIGFASIPRDRFVSLAASFDSGVVLTKRLKIAGAAFHVNAKADFGEILVEALDEAGRVTAASRPLRRDALDIPIEWQTGVPPKAGDTVALRFTLKNAHLFALWCS